jgi:hypothetical protein
MSGLLLLGVRTTLARQLAQGAKTSRRLARRELFTIERNRLAYACVLDDVFSDTRKEMMRLMHAARTVLPASTVAAHYRRLDDLHQMHQHVTAGLSPRGWWQFGGPEGPITQTLARMGVMCEIRETAPESCSVRLSAELSIAVYRLICEAVAYLMKHAPSDHVRMCMTVQARKEQGVAVIQVTIESLGEPLTRLEDTYERLLLNLGASGLNEQALCNRARLYGGDVQVVQTSTNHLRMVLSMTDQTAPS